MTNRVQATVAKVIAGNIDYRLGRANRYGGLARKLEKAFAADIIIEKIFAQLNDKEDMPEPTLAQIMKQLESLVIEVTSLNKRLNELEKQRKAGPYEALKNQKEET